MAVGGDERRAVPALGLRARFGFVVGIRLDDLRAEVAEALRFVSGAVLGRCTPTRTPNWRAAVASARPWLPAEAVMTRFAEGSAEVSRAIALAAPRILNEPVACSVSSFSQTSPPVTVESHADRTSGVRRATPWIRAEAATTSSRPLPRADVIPLK